MYAEIIVREVKTSPNFKENDSNFICDSGMVIIGRHHSGDEKGYTQYKQGKLEFKNKNYNEIYEICLYDSTVSEKIKEASSKFYCKPGQVIIGRNHNGDENGNTQYTTAKVKIKMKGSANEDCNTCAYTSFEDNVMLKESQKNTGSNLRAEKCVDDCYYPMVGREHNGDENGNTRTWFSKLIFELPDYQKNK